MINLTGKCPPAFKPGFRHGCLVPSESWSDHAVTPVDSEHPPVCGADGRKRCIINVAIGGNYPIGQARLIESLREVGYQGGLMTWTGVLPPGAPTEGAVPRGYKVYAFEHAQRMGYDLVLWLDAALWCARPVDRLFDWAKMHGAYAHAFRALVQSGEDPRVYERFGISADLARHVALVLGGIWGVDLAHQVGLELHNRMRKWVRTPSCFEADVNRDEGPLSIEMHRMGIAREGPPGAYQVFHLSPQRVVNQEFLDEHQNAILLHCGC